MLICLLYFLSTSTLHSIHSHRRKTLFPLAKVPYCVHFLSSCLYCTRFFLFTCWMCMLVFTLFTRHICVERCKSICSEFDLDHFSECLTDVDIYIFSLVLYCFFLEISTTKNVNISFTSGNCSDLWYIEMLVQKLEY